jgi:hypothetical protein
VNEQLQKELAAWLATMRESAEGIGNFALEQAPLLVQEKVLYGRVSALVWVSVAASLAICMAVVMRRHILAVKARRGERYDFLDTEPGILISCGAVGIASAIGTLIWIQELLMVWFAPRLYIAEWLASLVE